MDLAVRIRCFGGCVFGVVGEFGGLAADLGFLVMRNFGFSGGLWVGCSRFPDGLFLGLL